VIIELALGAFLLVGFGVWETFAPHPMIPGFIFSNFVMPLNKVKANCQRILIPIFLILAFGGVDFYSLAAFFVVEVQQLFGPDAYSVARILASFGFAFLIGIFTVGWGIDLSRGHIREFLAIGGCLMTAGVGGMIAVTEYTPGLAIGLSVIGMLGIGALYVPPVIILTIISGDEVIGTVVGLALAVRFLAGQAGYALLYNLLTMRLTDVIPTIVGTAVVEAGLAPANAPAFIEALVAQNITAVMQVPGVTVSILEVAGLAVDASYIEGFKLVYWVSIGFGAAAVIASLFLGNVRKYMTERVAVDIH
jgi:hypothetical protein